MHTCTIAVYKYIHKYDSSTAVRNVRMYYYLRFTSGAMHTYAGGSAAAYSCSRAIRYVYYGTVYRETCAYGTGVAVHMAARGEGGGVLCVSLSLSLSLCLCLSVSLSVSLCVSLCLALCISLGLPVCLSV